MLLIITDMLNNGNFQLIYAALLAIVILVHLGPYLLDTHGIRTRGITGPLLARLSDAWLGWIAARGHASEVIYEQHKRYGRFVRLAPNHVSICDPDALHVVYGHGNGALKSRYYDAFVSIHQSMFSARSRSDHTRKRKVVSHVFSPKNVLDFEPFIRFHVGELFKQWDKLCERSKTNFSANGNDNRKGHDGRVWFDCVPWFNYWAFDIIGDLAFGSPFGMIRNAKDAAPAAADQKAAMSGYGGRFTKDSQDIKQPIRAVKEVPAIKIVNGLDRYSGSMGVLPSWWRPIARLLPWYAKGSQALEDLASVAIAAVAKRLSFPTERPDLLSKLLEGKDEEGRPMSREELTSEALSILIAGSDTLANSSSAIVFYVAGNPHVQARLQKELDEALDSFDDPATTYAQVKRLPYLEAVINEGLRVHSTSGLGLPRVVPEGGLTVCGKSFPEGTVLSVPTYTIHRDTDVWGADADDFRPERWFERDQAKLQKVFNPFSYGPRACIGRNLAMTELLIIISSIFRWYDIVLEQPNNPARNTF